MNIIDATDASSTSTAVQSNLEHTAAMERSQA